MLWLFPIHYQLETNSRFHKTDSSLPQNGTMGVGPAGDTLFAQSDPTRILTRGSRVYSPEVLPRV